MDKSKDKLTQVSGKPNDIAKNQDGDAMVFFREKTIFGDRKPQKQEWLLHKEMYEAIAKTIDAEHITGLQRVNGFWRIHLNSLEHKVILTSEGLKLRGKIMPLLSTNPDRLDGEATLRICVKDIPLSVDDGVLTKALILLGGEVISCVRDKLRINGKQVNCDTGDRIIYVRALSLKEPLNRFMTFGRYKGKVFHDGQERKNKSKCTKCLEDGHAFKDCPNPWKCAKCLTSGHKQDKCNALDEPQLSGKPSLASTDYIPTNKSCDKPDENKGLVRQGSTQGVKMSTQSQNKINFAMSKTQSKSTPNKNKPRMNRSPPTPLEKLNTGNKKMCKKPADDDITSDDAISADDEVSADETD